jgi:hypothetical protein
MSARIDKRQIEAVAQAALDCVWLQWRALGAQVAASGKAGWMVDPEALVLFSLTLTKRERRLWDVLASWAQTDAGVLSVQRTKNLRPGFPAAGNDRLAEFAFVAFQQGGDHRWRNLAGAQPGPPARPKRLIPTIRRGWDPAALVVRLRLGLGVGLQADILSFLLSSHGGWAGSRAIAEATGYSVYAVRRVAERMTEARLIDSTAEKPLAYRADQQAWKGVLGLKQAPPAWRFWSQVYALVAELLVQSDQGDLEAPSSYLLSTRLRDLCDRHEAALRLGAISYSQARQYAGEEFVEAFEEVLQNLKDWLMEGA